MNRNEIFETIKKIIISLIEEPYTFDDIYLETILNPSGINTGMTDNTLSLSSLQLIELIVMVEQSFQIEISNDFMMNFVTVEDIVTEVEDLV